MTHDTEHTDEEEAAPYVEETYALELCTIESCDSYIINDVYSTGDVPDDLEIDDDMINVMNFIAEHKIRKGCYACNDDGYQCNDYTFMIAINDANYKIIDAAFPNLKWKSIWYSEDGYHTGKCPEHEEVLAERRRIAEEKFLAQPEHAIFLNGKFLAFPENCYDEQRWGVYLNHDKAAVWLDELTAASIIPNMREIPKLRYLIEEFLATDRKFFCGKYSPEFGTWEPDVKLWVGDDDLAAMLMLYGARI